ncbi:imidazole glycerol phosphate synthase subunit HisH [Aureimonas sp. AU12]|uniref:imidazole glycerol phosphate synthase subunit HisH n=1 Tax=Aureimonas sp. AU12 TaxID=1638161 RepID=UPI0007824452|nr:imidazole glycerol phosphate synthase subunit HisH [Aureimonas sp. AU12]
MTQTVAIIDYGSGNLRSATKAFERAAIEGGIDARIVLTDDPEIVRTADRVVLPGVGAYADCRAGLGAVAGMDEALREAVEARGAPFLGICVGMQLMAERGLEKTITPGFGWIHGDVEPIVPSDPALKVPQIGWNTIHVKRPHPLLAGIETGEAGLHAYFVHSYHLVPRIETEVVATADYGGPVTAIVAEGNKAGTQFHPEKSQRLGLALIANFLRWKP